MFVLWGDGNILTDFLGNLYDSIYVYAHMSGRWAKIKLKDKSTRTHEQDIAYMWTWSCTCLHVDYVDTYMFRCKYCVEGVLIVI